MTFKRLVQTIALNMQRGAKTRGDWCRKKKIFSEFGYNVRYQIRIIPLYPELIKIGSNINLSSGVQLITHDAIQSVYNHMPGNMRHLPEKAECIEICDNVFIGAGCTILGNVRIGPNVIVSANSLVNRDLEPGGIYGGTPARRIGDFDTFWRKREKMYYPSVKHNQHITEEEIRNAWEHFESLRS